MRFVLVLLLVCSLTGCGQLRQKYEAGRAFAKDMRPDHRYRSFVTESAAMEPAIRPKDLMLVDVSAYDSAPPQRGDIVVFMPPIKTKDPFIKRVVALPGDKLAIRNHTILVNGQPLRAPFPALHPDYKVAVASYRITADGQPLDSEIADVPPRSRWTAPDRLPRGCYFVLGDNVDNSEDSHYWGCAELSGTFSAGPRKGEPAQLVGKVVKVVTVSATPPPVKRSE